MNNDLISREALKKAIDDEFDSAVRNGNIMLMSKIGIVNKVLAIIDNAQPVEAFTKDDIAGAYNEGYACGSRETKRPQGEWISVSEKLPVEKINPITGDFENVLCSTVWNDIRTYKFGKPYGYDKPHFWHHGIMDEYVIAWQPLPEPYTRQG